ncbi:hypothetical protein ACLI1A_05720 [Flavobacterium sp. RHBU_3]|uniref:hypothetical protein n=1 Tax=Flavobacterium sp. RHBU_3 TaxID=3391184 RepID=UPI003984FCB4
MKTLLHVVLLLFSVFALAQDEHSCVHINKIIRIPDSLNELEIRIYKRYSITNGTEVFRMYQVNKDLWRAEFYEYYSAVPSANVKEHFTKRELQALEDIELTWYKILVQNILYLPSEDAIAYKFQPKSIECDERSDSYTYWIRRGSFLDGTSFKISIRDMDKKNIIVYSNPDSYLKRYPGVDELISVHELLEIICNNFGVWKE